MNKKKVVCVRFSEDEFTSMQDAAKSKNSSEIVRELALKGTEAAELKIQTASALIAKLENADVSKLAGAVARIEQKLDAQGPGDIDDRLVNALRSLRQEIGEIKQKLDQKTGSGENGDIKKLEGYFEQMQEAFVLIGRKVAVMIDPLKKAGLMRG